MGKQRNPLFSFHLLWKDMWRTARPLKDVDFFANHEAFTTMLKILGTECKPVVLNHFCCITIAEFFEKICNTKQCSAKLNEVSSGYKKMELKMTFILKSASDKKANSILYRLHFLQVWPSLNYCIKTVEANINRCLYPGNLNSILIERNALMT